MAIPDVPTIFLKLPNAVIGPDAEIVVPSNVKQPDYEVELAAVIGSGGQEHSGSRLETACSGLYDTQRCECAMCNWPTEITEDRFKIPMYTVKQYLR